MTATSPTTIISTSTAAHERGTDLYSRGRSKWIAERAAEIDAGWLHRIDAAEAKGSNRGRKKANWLRRQYLKSFSGTLIALQQDNERRKAGQRISTQRLIKVAEEISPYHPTGELVRLKREPKRNGGCRPIFSYGQKNRALQLMVRRAAEAGREHHPAQMSVAGRGGPARAIELIIDAINGRGFTHAIEFDIKDCFPSLTLEGTARAAGLPPRVLQNVAMATANAMDTSPWSMDTRVIASNGSLKGIAQGSLCAPSLANIVLKPLLEHVPDSAFAMMWVDNLLVLTKSKAEGEAVKNALCAAADQLPSGSLRITYGPVRRLCDGKTFLGGLIKKKKGIATAEPRPRSKNQFTAKAREILSDPPSIQRDQAYRSLARGFEGQHRYWPAVPDWTRLRPLAVAPVTPECARVRRALSYFWSNL
jgi:hypothetical protein